jgi:hypothetical protein
VETHNDSVVMSGVLGLVFEGNGECRHDNVWIRTMVEISVTWEWVLNKAPRSTPRYEWETMMMIYD